MYWIVFIVNPINLAIKILYFTVNFYAGTALLAEIKEMDRIAQQTRKTSHMHYLAFLADFIE